MMNTSQNETTSRSEDFFHPSSMNLLMGSDDHRSFQGANHRGQDCGEETDPLAQGNDDSKALGSPSKLRPKPGRQQSSLQMERGDSEEENETFEAPIGRSCCCACRKLGLWFVQHRDHRANTAWWAATCAGAGMAYQNDPSHWHKIGAIFALSGISQLSLTGVLNSLQKDVKGLKGDVKGLKDDMKEVNTRLQRIEELLLEGRGT